MLSIKIDGCAFRLATIPSILYSFVVAVFSPANALASPCSTWWEKILHAGKFCRWTSIVSMAYCPHFPTLQSNMSEFTLKNYSRIDYIDSLLFLGLCSPPDSSVHGILQARILEWVTIPFSRGSSWPTDQPGSPVLQADSLPSESSEKSKPLIGA